MRTRVLNRKTKKELFEILNIHQWLRYHYGRANECVNSECAKISKTFDYALIAGKRYERKLENFMMLCRKCHSKYDYDNGLKENQRKAAVITGKKVGRKNAKARARFTENDIKEIKSLYQNGSRQVDLASKYKIDQSMVSLIVNNKVYV